jgi:lipid A 3-O-deacylase
MKRLASLVAGAVMLCGAANAQLVEEARIGVVQHNICVLDCDNADKEDGPNINGELVFKSPDVLSIVWSPRPYVMASYNTAGNTNFGGVGLQWDFEFGDGWAIEPGIGYVFHDGANSSPFPQGDPRGDAFTEENVLFGSDDLFRTSLAVSKDLGDRWGVQLMYEHLSHGQILGNGRNQGLDNIGVRAIYRFGR